MPCTPLHRPCAARRKAVSSSQEAWRQSSRRNRWAHYCGLSGLINALVSAGLIQALRRRDLGAVLFGLLVLTKVLTESASGTALLTDTHWPAVPMAHVAGFVAGMMTPVLASSLTAARVIGGRDPGDEHGASSAETPGRPAG